jgi:hypothetical protein
MLTTKQVRNIMRNHLTSTYGLYTNKTTGDTTNIRRVKCYMPRDNREATKLINALKKAAGADNVNLTSGEATYGYGRPGITVRCLVENGAPF